MFYECIKSEIWMNKKEFSVDVIFMFMSCNFLVMYKIVKLWVLLSSICGVEVFMVMEFDKDDKVVEDEMRKFGFCCKEIEVVV